MASVENVKKDMVFSSSNDEKAAKNVLREGVDYPPGFGPIPLYLKESKKEDIQRSKISKK